MEPQSQRFSITSASNTETHFYIIHESIDVKQKFVIWNRTDKFLNRDLTSKQDLFENNPGKDSMNSDKKRLEGQSAQLHKPSSF